MNKARRNRINDIIDKLEETLDDLNDIAEDEQYSFDCLPENLQYSKNGEKIEETACQLDVVCDKLTIIIDKLKAIIK